jgi:hypothetical protein
MKLEPDLRGYCEDCGHWFHITLRALLERPYQTCPICQQGVAAIINSSDPDAAPSYVRYQYARRGG